MWVVDRATVRGRPVTVSCAFTDTCLRLDSIDFPCFWVEIDTTTFESKGRFDEEWFTTVEEKIQKPQCRVDRDVIVVYDMKRVVDIRLVPEM